MIITMECPTGLLNAKTYNFDDIQYIANIYS